MNFEIQAGHEPSGSVGYESFLAELSLRFVNLPADQVDGTIENEQRFICLNLGIERSSLFQYTEAGSLLLTHFYEGGQTHVLHLLEKRPDPKLHGQVYWLRTEAPAGECVPVDVKKLFPWVYRQLELGQPVILANIEDLPDDAAQDREVFRRYGTRSTVIMPLLSAGKPLGCISFATVSTARAWLPAELKRFSFLADVFTNALVRKRSEEALLKSYAEIKDLKDRLQAETEYLRAEIKTSHPHGVIIGRCNAIRRVLHDVEQVAPADCPVLLSGETGTGKELIAHEIHRLSPRHQHPMVLVNCAALPSALVESELFGRERGAYTGALTSQVGRFELANGSTIFLDEVGELPTEVQAKLLRVLQDGEFQRLGSPRTHKVNVRVIAATNRDVAEEVRKGRFREDLYYRLRVFPISIPPLRERVEDIPMLVLAFMEEFSTRMGKKITRIPRRALEILQDHSWPGNIRELRNIIEHSVILSHGATLKLTIAGDSPTREAPALTLAEAEREHILKTLQSTNWRIKGPRGAAARLDLQPSTLYSRMQKLGIPHRRQKDALSAES